jgi:hypothetical protein
MAVPPGQAATVWTNERDGQSEKEEKRIAGGANGRIDYSDERTADMENP